MPETILNKTVHISGMACASCEERIGKKLLAQPGVKTATANYKKSTLDVSFNPGQTSWPKLAKILADMEYHPSETVPGSTAGIQSGIVQVAGAALLVFVLYTIARHFGLFSLLNIFPEAESGMGYGMIFIVGLLTSTHCLAMCGGINLSQAALSASKTPEKKNVKQNLLPTLLYGTGRVISYTVIGALVGGLGSVMSFSTDVKGYIQIAAGVFMMIMGLTLLGTFPWLRRLVPTLPKSLSGKAAGGGSRGPLYVGLLNGLMPCGPLQAMQLFALSTGSPLHGALSMLVFSLGTLPLTMGLGAAAAFLGRRFMGKAIRVGAILVFLMGLAMLGNGLTLSGFVRPTLSGDGDLVTAHIENGRQNITTRLSPDSYSPLRLRVGIPVRWRLNVDPAALNGCNNRFLIPAFHIERKLVPGENLIEFTPDQPGIFPYMCWMGMIASRIIVGDVEDTGVTPKYDPALLPEADDEYTEEIPW